MCYRIFSLLALLAILLVGSPSNSFAQNGEDRPVGLPTASPESMSLPPQSLDAIDGLVDQAIADKKTPGAVVLIGFRGAIVFHRAYGNKQIEPHAVEMERETLFDLASLTKPIATATSIMMLVDRGLIELSDPVGKHLPAFNNHGKEGITIEQLLLHTSGLTPDNSMNDYKESVNQSIENIMELSLVYEPGTEFRYSDVGFLVLGELVRQKTGMSIHQFSQENLFQPLDMKATGYLPSEALRARAAVTEQRDGRWIQGEVHDPRAFALEGIAGHAGLFSTATDLAIYAQMMAQGGRYNGKEYLSPDSFEQMTAAHQVPKGLRGLGWDKRSGYSSNRGATMTDAAFGHGGFTGTAMWIDPSLELFVIFLSNRVHPHGKGSVNGLAGEIGTIAANAVIDSKRRIPSTTPANPPSPATLQVLCGIDVLHERGMASLRGTHIGLITNQTGVCQNGQSTAAVFDLDPNVELVAIFSPEHGFAGNLDQAEIPNWADPETGKKIFSLYGKDRKPPIESLAGIDTLVFDIQDIGTRFYTYISTMGNAMEVAAAQNLRFVVLDRPNPIGGTLIAGPMRDSASESFVAYHNLPVQHGMTVGELAKLFQAERFPNLQLEVIPCEGWKRSEYFDETGLMWINPSPNMRNLNQAILYPGIGLLEYTNLSVGRGTDTPFEHIGAPWIDATRLAHELQQMNLGGVRFVPKRFTPTASKFEGQACNGVHLLIFDREQVESVRIGLAIAVTLRKIHPTDWEMGPLQRLLVSAQTYSAIEQGASLDAVWNIAQAGLESFEQRRQSHLIYPNTP